ncbi:MAG: hypothetical protein SV966_08725 [Actinomycetota bacterium]|nr:hypothetical protein [Actinomycetota bacterium]
MGGPSGPTAARRLLIAVAVAGGVWLGALAVLAHLQIDLDAPSLGPSALPTDAPSGGRRELIGA